MNKKFKGFFNRNLRHDGGFTLVELIVVIAILAILAGVAVPAYSGYVTKANITADENLASEVENALILYYYSNPGTTGGWVALTPSGAKVGGAGEDAMKAVFGDSWESTAVLKHDGWKMTGGFDVNMMESVEASVFNPDDRANVNSMLGQVQNVVTEAADILAGFTVRENVANIMNAAGVTINTGDTLTAENAQAAANAYFYVVAGELAGINTQDDDDSFLEFVDSWEGRDFTALGTGAKAAAVEYATAFAYAQRNGQVAQLEALFSADPKTAASTFLNNISDSDWEDYLGDDSWNDAKAFLGYMQGVSTSQDSLLKNMNLNSTEYFTDGSVANFVDSYLEVGEQLNTLNVTNGIVISIDANGMVAVQKGKN